THFDTSNFITQIAGEVRNFNPEDFISKKDVRRMDRFCHFAIAATHEAVNQAGKDILNNHENIGVSIGCGIGGFAVTEAQHSNLVEKGPNRVSPFTIPMIIPNIAAGLVSIAFGAQGPCICPVTACASGANAIGDAFRIIERGDAEIMIAGGTEAVITPLSFAGFCAARAMSTRNDDPEKASRPFDKNRDGFVMGEGAGILILESLEHAQNRGANILAEIVGYGMSCDAHHITAPHPEGKGVYLSMKKALNDAQISSEQVDYINAHGTSTELNDKFESLAIKNLFEGNQNLLVSSTKSMTGHLLGAAGGIESIISIKSLMENIVPPTINYETPDPECTLNYVPNKAVEKDLSYVLSNNLGFGGHNTSLIFKSY
ncbi:MAG: beta-ketoacyl-ACP synthase II, partial [Candidatus Sericytochromatia bacterium]